MKTRFVKERLEAMGKDSEWLAGRCGVAAVTMKNNYLRGIVPPKSVLLLMAQALDCSVPDLVYEDGDRAKTA